MAAGLRKVVSAQFTLLFDYSATFLSSFLGRTGQCGPLRIDAGCYHSLNILYRAPSVFTGFRTTRKLI